MPDLDICRHEFEEMEIPYYFVVYTNNEDVEAEDSCVFTFRANKKNFRTRFAEALVSSTSNLSKFMDDFGSVSYNERDTLMNISFVQINAEDYNSYLELVS